MTFHRVRLLSSSSLVKTTAILLSGVIAATALPPLTAASAHERHGWRDGEVAHSHRHRRAKRRHRRHHRRHHRDDWGPAVAAGLIGLAIGAMISDANAERERRARRYEYDEPVRNGPREPLYDEYGEFEPGYSGYRNGKRGVERKPLSVDDGPKVITYDETASLEPWTSGWFDYCEGKYRSFNRKTGTFLGYDGNRHFCTPK